MNVSRRIVPLVVSLLCSVSFAWGGERPSLVVSRATGPIRVDGVLDEAAWATAAEVSDFQLMSPREGQTPSEATTVRVLRDGDRLVFAIRCQARRAPHASLAPRDQIGRAHV